MTETTIEKTKCHAKIGVGLLCAAMALTGCSHTNQPTQNSGTSAQIQQTAQQQAVQRAAYFNSHPTGGGQNPAANPAYRGHP